MDSVAADHFERLYQADPDPWRVASAWYERRKRGLLLAALGREQYRHAFEPGCGTGELTRCLALRCAQVCAVDAAPVAAERCRARVAGEGMDHVQVLSLDLPRQWPETPAGGFDLIVLSEVAYYLDGVALCRFLSAVDASLAQDGEIVACHWRPDFDDRLQNTDALHAAIGALPGLSRRVHHVEDEFRLDVWRRQPQQGSPS
ncbi:class I SAM-dependent methyltransferase [Achromobacter sp.]|jgi:cyclopropane fatty-acyl-phospholipid synthase-like methyltransferase|uniref:class I SAM-dependent methyltransferase n=1 Tax=Achromobacter sp. TaxID=134375 RepID=UPI0028A97CCD|nr:class I SAM-dependent methyltransferase [Achromobacter sp.]